MQIAMEEADVRQRFSDCYNSVPTRLVVLSSNLVFRASCLLVFALEHDHRVVLTSPLADHDREPEQHDGQDTVQGKVVPAGKVGVHGNLRRDTCDSLRLLDQQDLLEATPGAVLNAGHAVVTYLATETYISCVVQRQARHWRL